MDDLAKLAAAMRRDAARADASREALHVAILEALDNGARQVDIAKATGYTRERLRQIAAAKRHRSSSSGQPHGPVGAW